MEREEDHRQQRCQIGHACRSAQEGDIGIGGTFRQRQGDKAHRAVGEIHRLPDQCPDGIEQLAERRGIGAATFDERQGQQGGGKQDVADAVERGGIAEFHETGRLGLVFHEGEQACEKGDKGDGLLGIRFHAGDQHGGCDHHRHYQHRTHERASQS